jgi:molybdate transport system regulatory protein
VIQVPLATVLAPGEFSAVPPYTVAGLIPGGIRAGVIPLQFVTLCSPVRGRFDAIPEFEDPINSGNWTQCSELEGTWDGQGFVPSGFEFNDTTPFAVAPGQRFTFQWDSRLDVPPGLTIVRVRLQLSDPVPSTALQDAAGVWTSGSLVINNSASGSTEGALVESFDTLTNYDPLAGSAIWGGGLLEFNALSPEPIVYRETGGRDGGGTTVTAYGETLLETYAVLKEEHHRFLERLSQITDLEKGTFKTIGRLGLQISARNQIQAEVLKVEPGEVNARITLLLKSGQRLYSTITEEAVEDLHIEAGQTVTAICKSSNVVLLSQEDDTFDNCLKGQVVQWEKDRTNIKVVVDIGSHDRVVSVMAVEKMDGMQIQEGMQVHLGIEANNIMLGR